jgi:hypothetical protein
MSRASSAIAREEIQRTAKRRRERIQTKNLELPVIERRLRILILFRGYRQGYSRAVVPPPRGGE